nr:PREDICTED: facilitated trehalose transporter Tret1-like [Bemisia tabaci]
METFKEQKSPPPENWIKTFWACGGAITILVFNGVVEAHSAVLLPQLQEAYSPIHVDKDEETWIASLGISASPLSAVLCGPCIDRYGRKIVIQGYFLISAIGYGIIAAASSVVHLYIGRIICSLGVGFEVAGVIYIAEVCTKYQRSLFLSLTLPMFTGGILFTYVVGATLPWTMGSSLYALLCLLLFVYESFTPESPPWLVKQGKISRAKAEFKRLGRSDEWIEEELKLLQASCDTLERNHHLDCKTWLEPTVWKPFLIIALFHFLQAATGVYDLLYYTVDFVGELGTQYDPFQVSLYLAIARFLMTSTVGLYFTSKVRRKTATALSGFAMGASLLVAAIYEQRFDGVAPAERAHTWIPILAVSVSVLVSCAGVLHLPWLMSGEVFPLRVRGLMSGYVFFVGSCSMFVFLKSYVFFVEVFKVTGVLLLCAGASVLIALFGLFVLTETQDKSLYEIERGYEKKSRGDAEKANLREVE